MFHGGMQGPCPAKARFVKQAILPYEVEVEKEVLVEKEVYYPVEVEVFPSLWKFVKHLCRWKR